MLYLLAFVIAACVGFAGSRVFRRPNTVAQASSAARSVSGAVGARRGLDAPELQRACFSEMVRHVRVDRAGRPTAPASYVISLNPGDLAVVDEARRWFTDGLIHAMRDAASQNSWRIDGDVAIDYRSDPARRPGVPGAEVPGVQPEPVPAPRSAAPPPSPAAVEGPDHTQRWSPAGTKPSAAPPQPHSLVLVRGDTGERLVLEGQAITIGRSGDNTITAADDRISRAHARMEAAGSGWVVIDLGSANGTKVNGNPIKPGQAVPIVTGSMVAVGPLELTVQAHEAMAPGTRALETSDRTRISSEVLGLPGDRRR